MDARAGMDVRCCGMLLLMSLTVGCSTTSGNVGAPATWRWLTPSFLLSDRDRAERSLKDPKGLNLAYARFQEQIGQYNESRKSYELVLRDDAKSVDAVLGMARLDQLAEKAQDAEAGFQKAMRMKPGDPAVLAAAGQFYASQKRWPEALQALNAAVAAAPKEPIYKHQLGVVKTRSGDIAGGLAIFSEMVGAEKAHYNVAVLLKQDGRLDATAEQCRLALAINPNFEAARTLLEEARPEQQVSGESETGDRRRSAAVVTGRTAPR